MRADEIHEGTIWRPKSTAGSREGPVRIVKRIDYRYGTYFVVEPAQPAEYKVRRMRHRINLYTLYAKYALVAG